MKKYIGFVAISAFLFSCADDTRDNQYDERAVNYIGKSSSSSVPSSGSLGGGYSGSYGSVTYEDQTYRTVVIGTQTWMAENLNYNTGNSACYNCDEYGRLYDWAKAMDLPSSCNDNSCSSQIQPKHKGICPSGWHIPSDAEWSVLETTVGGSSTAGTKLKAVSGWNSNGNGTDEFGFSALPGGHSQPAGGFSYVGDSGYWWSATEYNASGAYIRYMNHYAGSVYRSSGSKSLQYSSVRCVQD